MESQNHPDEGDEDDEDADSNENTATRDAAKWTNPLASSSVVRSLILFVDTNSTSSTNWKRSTAVSPVPRSS